MPPELVPAFDRRTRGSHRLAGTGLAMCGLAVAVGLFDQPGPGPFLTFVLLCLGWLWLSSDRKRAIAFFARIGGFGRAAESAG